MDNKSKSRVTRRKTYGQLLAQEQRLYDENGRRNSGGNGNFWGRVERIENAAQKVIDNMNVAANRRGLQTTAQARHARYTAAERQGIQTALRRAAGGGTDKLVNAIFSYQLSARIVRKGKSLSQIELQRFRLLQSGLSQSRAERVNSAYRKYRSNIERALNLDNGRGSGAFINGRYQQARKVPISRDVYMGKTNNALRFAAGGQG